MTGSTVAPRHRRPAPAWALGLAIAAVAAVVLGLLIGMSRFAREFTAHGLGPWARVRHVTWPTALPYVMTGLRVGAAVALILAVTAEPVIDTPGPGQLLTNAQSSGAVAATYAVVVTGVLIGTSRTARALTERCPSSSGPSRHPGLAGDGRDDAPQRPVARDALISTTPGGLA